MAAFSIGESSFLQEKRAVIMIKRESVLRKEFILIENIWHCKDRVLDQLYFYFASKLISQKHIFNGKRRELIKIIIKNFSQSFYFLSLLY
ncbi:MAG: hypothetical protein L0G16_03820, partial [Weeksellaceae bacterium]|nr:hypothetical protein [Weeksellaceae bacterium]